MKRYSNFWGRVINTVLFYIGWLIAAMEAAKGHAWSGPLVIGVIVILHFYFVTDRRCEAIVVIALAVFGTLMDTVYSLSGFIHYNAPYPLIPWLAPPWITAMWVLFATTVNHAFAWMHKRLLIAAVFGAGGGVLTYIGGVKMGAASFLIDPMTGIVILGFIWMFAFPLCLKFSVWVQDQYGVTSEV